MSQLPQTDTEVVKYIYDFFGDETQRKKLLEECHEYIDAMSISVLQNDHSDSEIADLFVLALQFYLSSESIQAHVRYKLARAKDRIDDGYYETNPHFREYSK